MAIETPSDSNEVLEAGTTNNKQIDYQIEPLHELIAVEPTIIENNQQRTTTNTGILMYSVDSNIINKNKPWREIIKRKISDGGSDNEGIS